MADSHRYQVVTAAQAKIQSLELPMPQGATPPVMAPAQVVIRKKVKQDPGFEKQPGIVLVSMKRRVKAELFGNLILAEYPVLVLLVLKRSLRPEDLEYETDTRDLLARALWKPDVLTLADATVTYDVEYDPDPAFDVSEWSPELDVTGQMFLFSISETRNS